MAMEQLQVLYNSQNYGNRRVKRAWTDRKNRMVFLLLTGERYLQIMSTKKCCEMDTIELYKVRNKVAGLEYIGSHKKLVIVDRRSNIFVYLYQKKKGFEFCRRIPQDMECAGSIFWNQQINRLMIFGTQSKKILFLSINN